MPITAAITWDPEPLQPAYPHPEPLWVPFQFGANQNILKGTVVAQKVSDGKIYPYLQTTYVAAPATPAFTTGGADGTWPTGVYAMAISLSNAQGESLPSPAVLVSVTNPAHITVPALAGLDASATFVNVYVSGMRAAQIAVAAGATVATNLLNFGNAVAAVAPRQTNTAAKVTDGTQLAIGIMPYDVITDANGRVVPGDTTPGEFGQTYNDAPVFVKGYFWTQDLTGLDSVAVSQLGRLVTGTLANGVIALT